jgi:hypothetical protein
VEWENYNSGLIHVYADYAYPITNGNQCIKDIKLDGNDIFYCGISIYNVDHIKIENCIIEHFVYRGIYALGGFNDPYYEPGAPTYYATSLKILGCTLTDNTNSDPLNGVLDTYSAGIYGDGWDSLQIAGCTFNETGHDFNNECFKINWYKNASIHDNTFYTQESFRSNRRSGSIFSAWSAVGFARTSGPREVFWKTCNTPKTTNTPAGARRRVTTSFIVRNRW